MDIQNIVFDLDGTLLDSKHNISQENKEAIAKAQAAGINIILASGRGLQNMLELAKQLSIEHIICLNGAVVYSVKTKKVLFSQKLENKVIEKVHKYVVDKKVDSIFYTKDSAFILKESPHYEIMDTYFGTKSFNYASKHVDKIHKIILSAIPRKEESLIHVKNLKEILKDQDAEVIRSSQRSLDINSKNISKAQGLMFLSKFINIDLTKTAAFGDAGNDKKMLEAVSFPFVMGNAVEELKQIGFEIIGDNNSLAIANKLNSFIIKKG